MCQAGQGFGLAVTVAMVVISRFQGVVHRKQVEQGGCAIHQRIGQAGEQADRAAHGPGDGLGYDEDNGDGEGGPGGQAQQLRVPTV
ncbi:hypothetical protein D3C80_1585350 [compost metagenome]